MSLISKSKDVELIDNSDSLEDSFKKGKDSIPVLEKTTKKTSQQSFALSAELAQSWLDWQCQMVAGVSQGFIYLPSDIDQKLSVMAVWPEDTDQLPQLKDVASSIVNESKGMVLPKWRYDVEGKHSSDVVGSPLLIDKNRTGAIVLLISNRAESQQQAVLQLMQWCSVWVDNLVKENSKSQKEFNTFGTKLLKEILEQQVVRLASMETVNRLADQFDCERVSIGLKKGLSITLEAISHLAHFDSRAQLIRRIESAMEETVDQDLVISEPNDLDIDSSQTSVITRANKDLLENHGNGAICSIPLPGHSGNIGALILERSRDNPFNKETIVACESLASLIGPILEMKQHGQQSFIFMGLKTIKGLLAKIFGTEYLKFKLFILALSGIIYTLSIVPAEYKVTAPANIEGEIRQMLVAQQNGFIKQAEVRAGDLVKEGQLIAVLDDRDLLLQHKKSQSEKNKIDKKYQDALAKWDRTELSLLRAQLEQLDAELRLINTNLKRTRLVAPFDGIIVSGDLSQSFGAPVETGQILFEIALLDSYRVVIEVNEFDIADIEVGKTGKLIIAALPQKSFAITVQQIVPIADSRDGRNFFQVEATLDESLPVLRPGMHGVAKIEMGQRKLLWIWTHSTLDRLKLWLWSKGL